MSRSPPHAFTPKKQGWAPRVWLIAGTVLVGLWALLWESPEQALIGRAQQAVRALNAPDSSGVQDWEVFAEPATLLVGSEFEQAFTHRAARAAWRAWRTSTGLGSLELESIEAQLQPPLVRARLELGSQPGDLHAHSYRLTVRFTAVGDAVGKACIVEVRLSSATQDIPEARP